MPGAALHGLGFYTRTHMNADAIIEKGLNLFGVLSLLKCGKETTCLMCIPKCYYTSAGRQPLGLDLININEYAKVHQNVIRPNLCYTRQYDVLCQNLSYLRKYVMSEQENMKSCVQTYATHENMLCLSLICPIIC